MMINFILLLLILATVVSADSTCVKDMRAGKRNTKKVWKALSGTCEDAAWNFEDEVRQMVHREFRNTRNASPKEKTLNRCAKRGVKSMLAKHEKKCFSSTTKLCKELAQMAAEIIVNENQCELVMMEFAPTDNKAPKPKTMCRELAEEYCPFYIEPTIEEYCTGRKKRKGLKSRRIWELQNLCADTVGDLLDGN